MGTRRFSREAAMQFLYQDDLVPENQGRPEGLKERFDDFCGLYQVNKKGRDYAFELIEGVEKHRAEIDALVEAAADNWRVARISPADRNILRVASYEMKFREDVPPQVAINEAVEISKRFCAPESPKFINGVLDAVRKLSV